MRQSYDIPDAARDRLCRELLRAMRRVQSDRPDVWDRIEKRAETLRKEGQA